MQCPACGAGRSSLLIVRERGRVERTSVTCLACRAPDITPLYPDSGGQSLQGARPVVDELTGWTPDCGLDRYYYPGSGDEAPKEGYKRHIIGSISEADRLTREMDRHYRQQTLEQAEANNAYFDAARKERRASIDNEMRRLGMDGSGRARFIRDAIRRYIDAGAERKRRRQLSGGPNTSIQVFDRDSGNRQDYSRDGRERGRKA